MKKQVLIAATLIGLGVTNQLNAQVIYNFDGLVAGSNLIGQDGWTISGTGNSPVVQSATTNGIAPNNVSGNVLRSNTAVDTQMFRINDANFSYSLNNTDLITIEMQIRAVNTGQAFAPAAFGINTTLNTDRIGPVFGTNNSNFWVRRAGTSANSTSASLAQTTTGGAWTSADLLLVRLTIDPTALSGDGLGNMSATNLTLNDGEWVNLITNYNLTLTNMAVGFRTPDTWDGMYIRTGTNGGNQGFIDNIAIIPEPSTAGLLLGASALLLALRRRRKLS